MRSRWNDDRGSALPLLAIVLGGVALALMLVLVQGRHRVTVAQAQWAADGAALAAATEMAAWLDDGGPAARSSAARVAEANGARLVSIEIVDAQTTTSRSRIDRSIAVSPTVLVEVEIDGVLARAAAARFAVAER